MSDSQEEPATTLTVPPELDEWLAERAAALDVDREELLVQLLSSYRAVEDLHEELADPIESAVDERLDDAAAVVEERFEQRLADLEAEFQSKIVDVRERVIQVKTEADGKAPKHHSHEDLETLETVVEALEDSLDDLQASVDDIEQSHEAAVDDLRAEIEATLADTREAREDLDERLSDATDKLRRVAWVVSDLKDEVRSDDAHEQAVARIKRAAAQEGVSTATCDSCGDSVDIALLTAPECPHCDATISDVRPTGGIFRKKARLVAAAQLESGEEREGS